MMRRARARVYENVRTHLGYCAVHAVCMCVCVFKVSLHRVECVAWSSATDRTDNPPARPNEAEPMEEIKMKVLKDMRLRNGRNGCAHR